MRRMIRCRSSRSLVELVTAMMLMMCQTAFATQACAHSSAPAAAHAVSAPCHETLSDTTSPDRQPPAASARCDVSHALPDAAKVPILAVSYWPSVIVTYLVEPAPQRTFHALQTVRAA